MKKLFIILGLVFAVASFGQTRKVSTMVTAGDTTSTLTDDGWIRLHTIDGTPSTEAFRLHRLTDSLPGPVFNVVEIYNAPNDGSSNAADEIQSAVDAAAAETYGGIVYIPSGIYTVSDSIILKSYVEIIMSKYTTIETMGTYGGPIFYAGSGADLKYCKVSGGRLKQHSETYQYGTTGIRLDYQSGDDASSNSFENIIFWKCDTAISVLTDNSGWVNSNVFHDLYVHNGKRQVVLYEGPTSSGASGNTFSNLHLQSSDSTYSGVEVWGNGNVFSNIIFWDFGTGTPPSGQRQVKFLGDATGNVLVAGDLGDTQDGYLIDENFEHNMIVGEGFDFGSMRVAHTVLTYDSEAVDTILQVRGNIYITDIQIGVSEAFTDTGTDYIDVGYSSSLEHFVADADVSSTTFVSLSPSNLPKIWTHASGAYLTAVYDGQNNDADAGSASVLITYTRLLNSPGNTDE